ncbi:MAG: type VI secretion system contractile sheath small subunit [Holosporales bacterium]|jgi:type VI secretion system protein ImpB|nr:type VI secretion system contractile sheath small subunit [Holosporales bacterium]
MAESRQHTLSRIRKPRVHITYDVEIGDAIEKKELTFVVAVLADLSGHPETPLPKIMDRKFVEIDRDNFNEVMAIINPRLVLRVSNRLSDETPEVSVELNFNDMGDFQPQNVAQKIPSLKALYDKRNSFKNLIAKMDGNDKLETMLTQVMRSHETLKKLKKELDDRSSPPADASEEQSNP